MHNKSKIALGAVQFGVDYGINSTVGQVQPKEVEDILSYAYVKGIDLLDTAPAYGNSEQVLGEASVDNFKVVTKTRYFNNTSINSNDLKLLDQDFLKSLVNLKQDSVYGVLVHNADDLFKSGSAKIIDKLQELKQKKKIKKIGVSIYSQNQLQSIIENFDIDIVQLPFNIIDGRLRESDMLAMLKKRNVEIHARSVFLQGLLLMGNHDRPRKFNNWSPLWKLWHEWLNDNQITALEATIRHAISTSEISKVLVGVHSKKQLEEIVIASNGVLPSIPADLLTNDLNLLNPSNWNQL